MSAGFDDLFGPGRSTSDRKETAAVQMNLTVVMRDQGRFAAEVARRGLQDDGMNTDKLVAQVAVIEHPAVEVTGLESWVDEWLSSNQVRVKIEARVQVPDVDAATHATRELYEQAWNDADWWPRDAAEMVYELLVASHPGPDPEHVGLELQCTSDDAGLIGS